MERQRKHWPFILYPHIWVDCTAAKVKPRKSAVLTALASSLLLSLALNVFSVLRYIQACVCPARQTAKPRIHAHTQSVPRANAWDITLHSFCLQVVLVSRFHSGVDQMWHDPYRDNDIRATVLSFRTWSISNISVLANRLLYIYSIGYWTWILVICHTVFLFRFLKN